MKNVSWKPIFAVILIVATAAITDLVVSRYRTPGRLDPLTAQAMDMSAMRPPTGAALAQLATVRLGSLGNTVTYTGSVVAYNEQEISSRVTGTILALPVYPGDNVVAGQLVARLDSAEATARAQEAAANAAQARIGHQVAVATHHLHHAAALSQASAQRQVAESQVNEAKAQLEASKSAIDDAKAGVDTARASADYWAAEMAREKTLLDRGAVSRQEYQNEFSQASAANSAVTQALARVQAAQAMEASAKAKLATAKRASDAAIATEKMADADIEVAAIQASQAGATADAARNAQREAAIEQGYTRIVAPAAGVVTERPVAPGTLVQPGTIIAKIAEIDRVRIQAHVATADLAGIHVGSAVTVIPQTGAVSQFSAAVTAVFPSADESTRTAVVEAVVDNPGHRLLPGAYVTMKLTNLAVGSKLLVPAEAVLSESGQSFLWVAKGQGGTAAPTEYECAICHMHYSAEKAKLNNYRDPMDGGKLNPIASSSAASASTNLVAHRVDVAAGASDGNMTEVESAQLHDGDRVVVKGQAGMTEGAVVASVTWAANGPAKLPTASDVSRATTVYQCEKCGMTYSAADARKNGYIDPMDGGKLSPVTAKQ